MDGLDAHSSGQSGIVSWHNVRAHKQNLQFMNTLVHLGHNGFGDKEFSLGDPEVCRPQ
jgi:hypothetical protein